MKYFTLTLILFIASLSLTAQQIQIIDPNQPMVLPDGKVGSATIEGSPFLNKNYVTVILNNLDGSNMTMDQGRYNAHAQKIEVVKEGEKIWVNDHKLAGFTLKENGKHKKYVRFIIEQQSHYLEELVKGKTPLLMLSVISVIEPKQQDNTSYNKETGGVYKYGLPKVTYYTIEEGKLSEVPTTKKKFLEAMPSKYQNQFSDKIKKDKLKPNKKEDLQKLFQFYNSLIAD